MMMDPSDAIVNAILADPGPAYAYSSAVTNTNMSDRHKKEERKAVRVYAALHPQKREGPLTRRYARKLPDLPPDALRNVAKFAVVDDEAQQMKYEDRIFELEDKIISGRERVAEYNRLLRSLEEMQNTLYDHENAAEVYQRIVASTQAELDQTNRMLDDMPEVPPGAGSAPLSSEIRKLFLRKETFKIDKKRLTNKIENLKENISDNEDMISRAKSRVRVINDHIAMPILNGWRKGGPDRLSRLEKELQEERQEFADFNARVAV
jgi:DNA repair exonuclease SbcCD ATPase subunit